MARRGDDDMSHMMGRMRMDDYDNRDQAGSSSSYYVRRGGNDDFRRGGGRGRGRGRPPRQSQPFRPKGINIAKDDLEYQTQKFIARPDRAIEDMNLGRKTEVEANYLKLELPEKPIQLTQYNIEILMTKTKRTKNGTQTQSVPVVDRTVASRIFHLAWLDTFRDVFPADEHDIIYNDVNMLWTPEKLRPPQNQNPGDFTLELTVDRRLFEIHIMATAAVTLDKTKTDVKSISDIRTVLDALLTMRLKYQLQGNERCVVPSDNKIFYAMPPGDYNTTVAGSHLIRYLSDGVEAWTGLHGAVKPECRGGLLYNVDLSHSLFYARGKNLVEFIAETFDTRDEAMTTIRNSGMPPHARRRVEEVFKGRSMYYQLDNSMPKRYFKFSKLTPRAIHTLTFTEKNERNEVRPWNVLDYLRHKYNYTTAYPHLPAVEYKQGMYVPMDRCYFTDEITKYKGRVQQHLLGRFIRETAMTPDQKLKMLKALTLPKEGNDKIPSLFSYDDPWTNHYGVRSGMDFMRLKATILPAPGLVFGSNPKTSKELTRFVDRDRNDGVWELVCDNKFRQTLETTKCVMCVVYVNDNNQPKPDRDGANTLLNVLTEIGLEIYQNFKFVEMILDQPNNIDDFITKIEQIILQLKEFAKNLDKDEKVKPIILFILNGKFSTITQRTYAPLNIYQAIKYYCDVKFGCYSQVILRATYNRMVGNIRTCATAHNVALKVLAKLGVSLFKLDPESHKNWAKLTDKDAPTLVLSVDITHPSADQRIREGDDSYSVASIVGNIDLELTKFGTSSILQRVGEELIVKLDEAVHKRISDFKEHTGLYPQHLVVYRDGISETEFKKILYEEKAGIERIFPKISDEYKPTLTYIVATKRHHTCFFPTKPEDTLTCSGNLRTGTLVESVVTTKDYYDFFLLSQHAAIGTSRPTHYYVLLDDWSPSHAFWPTITHALSYNYARCMRAVSIPGPIFYAHHSAKRAKEYLTVYNSLEGRRGRNFDQPAGHDGLVSHIHRHPDIDGMVYL